MLADPARRCDGLGASPSDRRAWVFRRAVTGACYLPPMTSNQTGRLLRQAAADGEAAKEYTMYPTVIQALSRLLPTGFEAKSHGSAALEPVDPDISLHRKHGGGVVAVIEVKRPAKLPTAFQVGDDGRHQIDKYREGDTPVLLTDAIRWFDVTDGDDLSLPLAAFDSGDDETAKQQLKSKLHFVCGTRPKHTADSAVAAMAGIVEQINAACSDDLSASWEIVRDALGFDADASLDGAGVGEIIAFALLSIAAHCDDIDSAGFAGQAAAEWESDEHLGDLSSLPPMMRKALERFRLDPSSKQRFGAHGWQTVRAVAHHVTEGSGSLDWARLSALWDNYLHNVGRRAQLGSWQTPQGLARYQAQQTHEALVRLGYTTGLGDPDVTIIDPCVGTGVYLHAIVSEAEARNIDPEQFNGDPDTTGGKDQPRLLGADISPAAVAACQIRMESSRAAPRLFVADTLLASAGTGALSLFPTSPHDLVNAMHHDRRELTEWASRDPSRRPILAIVGNPPYQRGGLDSVRYKDEGWYSDVYASWLPGSGGGGTLKDPYAAFWAWAFQVCRQRLPGTPSDSRPFMWGVVSFVTNRTWILGDGHGPMRKWVRQSDARVDITDFGPGARGGKAGIWSKQPFDIQAGTAVVTVTFDPTAANKTMLYRKAEWVDGTVRVLPDSERSLTGCAPGSELQRWDRDPPKSSLLSGMKKPWVTPGVKTGNDSQIVTVKGSAERIRHAYRTLDNRFIPRTVPPRDEQPPGGRWREETLFYPHLDHQAAGGWYAILPAHRAEPGPAIHATIHLPDYHMFKGSEGGTVVRVAECVPVPDDYGQWAASRSLDGPEFWLYALAAAHHPDYWTEGTVRAESLAVPAVEIPLADDKPTASKMVAIGRQLVDAWSVRGVKPRRPGRKDGEWQFWGHDAVKDTKVNGYPVLDRWRKARPEPWDMTVAAQYAEVVAALRRIRDLSEKVGRLID